MDFPIILPEYVGYDYYEEERDLEDLIRELIELIKELLNNKT